MQLLFRMTTGISLQMGTKNYELSNKKDDWLWNIAKRALPTDSADSDVLHYMRYLADKNGLKLDSNNNIDRAKLPSKINIPKYEAPTTEAMKKDGVIAPHMSGPAVTDMKKNLNQLLKDANQEPLFDEKSDKYDPATRAALALMQKNGKIKPRKDGLFSRASLNALKTAYPKAAAKDTLVKNDNTKTTPLEKKASQEVKAKPSDTWAATKELYKNDNFKKLDARQRSDVTRAMSKAGSVERQEYLGSLATKGNFADLSIGERQEVLRLGNTDNKDLRKTLDEIVGKPAFKSADPEVRQGLLEMLSNNPKSSAAARDVLDATDKKMQSELLSQARGVFKTEPTKKPTIDSIMAVHPKVAAATKGQKPNVVALMTKLGTSKNFDKLTSTQRSAVLELAKHPSADMRSALLTITDSNGFLNASPRVQALVLKTLEKKPKQADEVDHALKVGASEADVIGRLNHTLAGDFDASDSFIGSLNDQLWDQYKKIERRIGFLTPAFSQKR